MEDAEIIAAVANSTGCGGIEASLEPLSGRQGLLVCRVRFLTGQSFVFKAIKDSVRREIPISNLLGRICPDFVPGVIAAEEDVQRGLYWLILEDVGSRRLKDCPTVENYSAAAATLARVQIAALNELEALNSTDIPSVDGQRWDDVGLRVLESLSLQTGRIVLDSTCIEEVVWSIQSLVTAAYFSPFTLIHGDLHSGNVAIQRLPLVGKLDGDSTSAVRLLDWGSAYLGSAFLGLEELLGPACRYLRRPDERARVRAAYLKEWSALLGRPRPLEATVLACSVLARLQMLDEALRRPQDYDEFSIAALGEKLLHGYRAWIRG